MEFENCESLECFMTGLFKRNPGEPEFHQAVREVAESIVPFVHEHRRYKDAQILERMTEPDRIVIFRVTWEDDEGRIRANRAWRVQFNNSIGPYKGGMRFHPSVTLGVLKFLGFEQTFKNSLTGLPMGGAKGGANCTSPGQRGVGLQAGLFTRDWYRAQQVWDELDVGGVIIGDVPS